MLVVVVLWDLITGPIRRCKRLQKLWRSRRMRVIRDWWERKNKLSVM
jgi:hypothetical protein